MSDSYQSYKPFFRELADASGAVALRYYGTDEMGVETKADQTPVTRADREAEQVIRELINKRYPQHGIIGEEFGKENPDAEFVWVLDPIDGTKSYAAAVPLYGTLLCLLHEGKPVLGAIHQPNLKKYLIGDGTTTELNGKPVRVSDTANLSEALLLTTDALNPKRRGHGAAWDRLTEAVHLYRCWGDCWGYLMVATGWAEIMADPQLEPWDMLSLVPIIRGAGGVITTWDGRDPLEGKSVLATTPALHGAILEILNG